MSAPSTRKRPAPCALPITSSLAQPNVYTTRSGRPIAGGAFPRLQSPSAGGAPAALDPALAYPAGGSPAAGMAPQAMLPGAPNQLARRPMNQAMIPRAPYQNGVDDAWSSVAQQQQQPPPQQDQAWISSTEDDRVEQEAGQAMEAARKSRRAIPPFVQKLRSFLEDPKNTNLIRWSKAGDSFIVFDEEEFAKTLIPELFKHANYASFVRQLNMYGFHKKVGLSDNSMRASERKNKSPSEYANQYFRRDKPDWMWLIKKPQTAPSKGKGSRVKQGDSHAEEVEEVLDGEVPGQAGPPLDNGGGIPGPRQPLMIGQGDPTQISEQLANVSQELRLIRQNHHMLSNVLQRLRRQHEEQAAQFQAQHERHENSINAMLTFLATVYNRSLEGAGNPNMANLFAGTIPHELAQSGQVVGVSDIDVPGMDVPGGPIRRSPRRQPLLLKAPPPSDAQTVHTMSAASTPAAAADSPMPRPDSQAAAGGGPRIEELQTPTPASASGGGGGGGVAGAPYGPPAAANSPEPDILSMINSANAHDASAGRANRMSFPQALSHLQTADGKAPLTSQERRGALQRMAHDSGAPAMGGGGGGGGGTHPATAANGLGTPEPPDFSGLAGFGDSGGGGGGGAPGAWPPAGEADFAFLERTLKEQDDKMSSVSNVLRPLSPSGAIPGLHDNGMGGAAPGYGLPPAPSGLNFDELFNTGDYFADATGGVGGAGGVDNLFADPDGSFDFGAPMGAATTTAGGGEEPPGDFMGAPEEEAEGPLVETVNNSAATSPAATAEEGRGSPDEGLSPRKRRRRN